MIAELDSHFDDVLTVAVLTFVGARLFNGLRRSMSGDGRATARIIVSKIGWRHVWPVPFVLSGVIVVATTLIRLPILDWGWWTAIGGQGNPVFGSSDSTSGTVWEWLVPALFLLLLIPALPLFAYAEEQMFRRGAEHWSQRKRALKVVQFGLVHTLIGIPIGTAIALSIGGAYFMQTYLRSYAATGSAGAATIESARAHTTYNALIVGFVIVVVIVAAFQ
ncbi:MAG: hypothetical protein JWM34_3560 [Ilumatobacteraceae bacterium]|nr:hypothetical protein [Ilumatobacteraceae bacterium]